MTHEPSQKAILRGFLSLRNQEPDRVGEIDERIRATFERTCAILVLDMSGFSRLTKQLGIIHYLAMIEQMDSSCRPAVEGNGGTVVKQEADNLFAVFETPLRATEGALDIFRAFEAVNAVVPETRDLYGSIGIGYGPLLVIGDEDCFGDEMNLACKLGEDLGAPGEILLTPSAAAELSPDDFVLESRQYSVSGLSIDAFRLVAARYGLGPLESD